MTFLLSAQRSTFWRLAIVGFVASLALALAALRPRAWRAIKPTYLRDALSDGRPSVVVGVVSGSKVEMYEANRAVLKRKRILWHLSVATLVGATVLAALSTAFEAMP